MVPAAEPAATTERMRGAPMQLVAALAEPGQAGGVYSAEGQVYHDDWDGPVPEVRTLGARGFEGV